MKEYQIIFDDSDKILIYSDTLELVEELATKDQIDFLLNEDNLIEEE